MKENFKWTTYSEELTKDDGLIYYITKPIESFKQDEQEFTSCLIENNYNIQDLVIGGYGAVQNQVEMFRSCAPSGSIQDILLHNLYTNGYVNIHYYANEVNNYVVKIAEYLFL